MNDGETLDSNCRSQVVVEFGVRFGVVSQGQIKGQ
jgi:hypothetical protein